MAASLYLLSVVRNSLQTNFCKSGKRILYYFPLSLSRSYAWTEDTLVIGKVLETIGTQDGVVVLAWQVKIWFQNRRTKWKKQENLSNAEAAEHRACVEHRRTSDHRRRSSICIDDTSTGGITVRHSPPSLVGHPLTVALASPSAAALQFPTPRVFVGCHDPAAAFSLPVSPPNAAAVTSFPFLTVSRLDDVTQQRRDSPPSRQSPPSVDGRHDSDVTRPVMERTDMDTVGSDGQMVEIE